MIPEAQRIAIAEACGWNLATALEAKENGISIMDRRFSGFKRKLLRWDSVRIWNGWADKPGFHQIDIDESNGITTDALLRDYQLPVYWRLGDTITRRLPNYLSDLNAIHKAEERLFKTHEQMGCTVFYSWLKKLTDEGAGENHFLACRATAAQRAEAFLRTLGKWKD